ncbi:MAG: acetyl-CoA carboxylase carboxyltransferase subunit alpha [Planctomycetaceae bacterium]|jgi:acetyl-CoA carboxylase carboxyl transferase subunit alpha|nr:acetyl-CoA carboxylase carboxyltransferase subunit alpha [Planctomycetaceae bacterium]MBT6154282.1 acetyl-CoA carboxylase carboxyltransferase subunit alpha [Planctomycetaceae bacterium]MBT6485582.1 acetyl-CoA carboxylase carboxyltransferase subunit alpha [Planctomycetaceae bacterium]MBT6495332.1 acetyl-CoA carboxylase carboxyltransferase subunit alpha [Planctomycetaceae bacterium]
MPPPQILQFERPIFEMEEQLQKLQEQSNPSAHIKAAIRNLRVEIKRKTREIFDNLDPWQTVKVARHPERPQTLDYLELVFDEFIELHGDKSFRDDPAMLSGFAKLEDRKVMFVGQHKGRTLDERNAHNYGMPNPEGYCKALAKMETAAKFGLPIICFIDTPGAYPGIGAEERGQAYQIAVNLRDMSRLKTPIICVVIGEGGSGGALGIGIGDHICVLQFAYYSVISPEGCAGILWKQATPENSAAAAQALKFTAPNLLELGVIDEVIPEPLGGAHRDHRAIASTLKKSLLKNLKSLSKVPVDELPDHRYEKFRRIGAFDEGGISDAS